MKNITLRQLRSIQAVDRSGKISAAANELGLTAPAVTLQIQQVEKLADIALFQRTSEGVQTTTAGRAFVESAGAIREVLEQLEDRIDSIKGVRTGRIRLGIVSTAKYFAPFMVATFKEKHPDVEIIMTVGNRDQMIHMLNSNEADLFIMGRPPVSLKVNTVLLGDHPFVIVADQNHPLRDERDITKNRIANETFIIREKGSGTRTTLEIFLGEIPGKLDSLGIELDSNETIKQAVMAKLGVAFISAHTIAQEVESGRLRVLDVIGMPIRRQWFLISRAERGVSPAITSFQNYLIAHGSRHLPHFSGLYSTESDRLN